MAFKKGQSGNPGGRPKLLAEVQDAARKHTLDAVKTLVEIMKAKDQPSAARVRASEALLDRGWGKPGQSVEVTGANGGPIESINKIELVAMDGNGTD